MQKAIRTVFSGPEDEARRIAKEINENIQGVHAQVLTFLPDKNRGKQTQMGKVVAHGPEGSISRLEVMRAGSP